MSELNKIPKLKHHEGSYIARRILDDEVICELFKDDRRLPNLNFDKYYLQPIGEYLSSLNDKPKPEINTHVIF